MVAQLPVPLTTIVTPAEEIGAAGVRLLLELIANPDAEPENITLPVELVVRASTSVVAVALIPLADKFSALRRSVGAILSSAPAAHRLRR